MPKKKPFVLVTRCLPKVIENRIRQLFNAHLSLDDAPLGAGLVQAVRGVDILVPTVTDRIDAAVIEAADRLRLIANFGSGVDHIDLAAAHARGILVSNTAGVLAEDAADMTMVMILAVPRRVAEGARIIPDDLDWRGWSPTWMLGRRISGMRLGIVGMGRIGQAVARRAKAFGLSIHYHNRRRLAPTIEQPLEAIYWEALDEMLPSVDIVSIHCPHTPATYHLLSAQRLRLLKKEACVVNMARGEVIDEAALAQMIEAGDLAGAALDTFQQEPRVNRRLVRLARKGKALLMPHMGSATIESRIDMGEQVILNIRAFLDGNDLPDRVLPNMV